MDILSMCPYKTKDYRFTHVKADMEGRKIEAHASIFGNLDSDGDIVERGAFAKTIKEQGQRVRALWQHDIWDPIGRPEVLEEDSKGLLTLTPISRVPSGEKTLILVSDGVITDLSIGYEPVKQEPDGKANRLKEVALWEYSFVTFGANSKARVTGVKALADLSYIQKHYHLTSEDILHLFYKALQSLVEPLTDGTLPDAGINPDDLLKPPDEATIKALEDLAKYARGEDLNA